MRYKENSLMQCSLIPLAEVIKRNYSGRTIFLYGVQKPLRDLLKTADRINVEKVITGIKEKVTDKHPYIKDAN